MTAQQVAALMFAAWVLALAAAGVWAVWRLIGRDIDRATTLPAPHRPARLPLIDDTTERIDPALIPHDLPRRGSLIDRSI